MSGPQERETTTAPGPARPSLLTGCPEPGCPLPAGISARWVLESTDGPVEHVHVHCPAGHWSRMPTALLRSAG